MKFNVAGPISGTPGSLRFHRARRRTLACHDCQRTSPLPFEPGQRAIRPAAQRTTKSLAVLEESPALGSFCQNLDLDCNATILQSQVEIHLTVRDKHSCSARMPSPFQGAKTGEFLSRAGPKERLLLSLLLSLFLLSLANETFLETLPHLNWFRSSLRLLFFAI
jgi:hypothetical protein